MKRRTLKKEISRLSQRLVTPTRKYLSATARVHPDVISNYEKEIEFVVVDLMCVYLILDPSWPHPNGVRVIELVTRNSLPIRLCRMKDCSDELDANGKLKK